MFNVGQINGVTQKLSVGSSAPAHTAFIAGGAGASTSRRIRYAVVSDDVVHIQVNNDAAATSAFRLPKDTLIIIEMFGGDFLSYIVGTGVSSANLWVTEIST